MREAILDDGSLDESLYGPEPTLRGLPVLRGPELLEDDDELDHVTAQVLGMGIERLGERPLFDATGRGRLMPAEEGLEGIGAERLAQAFDSLDHPVTATEVSIRASEAYNRRVANALTEILIERDALRTAIREMVNLIEHHNCIECDQCWMASEAAMIGKEALEPTPAVPTRTLNGGT